MYSTRDYVAAAVASLMLIGPLAMAPHYKEHNNEPVGIPAPPNTDGTTDSSKTATPPGPTGQ